MREFNALSGYPEPSDPRMVSPGLRTLHHRLVACERGSDFYDGERCYGFGGLKYDGRWVPIAERICDEYKLDATSSVLQIGCDKGFLLHDFTVVKPGISVSGIEISSYAQDNALPAIKNRIQLGSFTELPFNQGSFDFIVVIGGVYSLNLRDAVRCLREIQRVGKGRSFITLGAYENAEDYRLFKMWSLLGATILTADEWREVMKYAGYTGDYWFMTAGSLHLVEKGD